MTSWGDNTKYDLHVAGRGCIVSGNSALAYPDFPKAGTYVVDVGSPVLIPAEVPAADRILSTVGFR